MPPRSRLGRAIPESLRPLAVGLALAPRRIADAVRNRLATVHPAPIFVLGNQKSGTSAIAALLGAATGLEATLDFAAEFRDAVFPEVLRGERSFDSYVAHNRRSFSRPIVKEPNLTLLVDPLLRRFPRSKLVFVVRDPRDNVRSLLDWFRLPGDRAIPIDDALGAGLSQARRLVLDNRWLGLGGADAVEGLALRWRHFAAIALAARSRSVVIRYEDFERDERAALRSLATQLGLAVRHDVGDRLDVAYQPRGDRSRPWSQVFGEARLAAIERICAAEMAAFGYRSAR